MIFSYTEIALGHNGFHIDFIIKVSFYEKSTTGVSRPESRNDFSLPYIILLPLPQSVYVDNDELVS